MKRCYVCKEFKPLDQFHKSKREKDGRVGACKSCRSKKAKERYARPEVREKQLIQQRKRYHSNPEVRQAKKEYIEAYRSDPENLKRYKEYNKWYRSTEKGRRVFNDSHSKYKAKHPLRIKAKAAVNNAVQRGELPPVHSRKCRDCSKPASHYHHWSYDPSHWLDVIPLCSCCHAAVHTN